MGVLNVLIIGCGNIAGGFDEGSFLEKKPYTHAGAYINDGRFKILACVEPDEKRRNEFTKFWNIPIGFEKIEQVLNSNIFFDVISICSPTVNHFVDLKFSLKLKPSLIFCEKPIALNINETSQIVQECIKSKTLLVVNFTRRWAPDIALLNNNINNGKYGELRSIVAYYNKGLLNNGSHIIDLLHMFLGKLEIVNVGKPIYDFFENDPSIPVLLEGPNELPINLVCGHADDFSIFELHLIFSLGIISMENGGFNWRERYAESSKTFKGYKALDLGLQKEGEYSLAMLNAVDNIYRAINNNELIASSGETALPTQRLCEMIKNQINYI